MGAGSNQGLPIIQPQPLVAACAPQASQSAAPSSSARSPAHPCGCAALPRRAVRCAQALSIHPLHHQHLAGAQRRVHAGHIHILHRRQGGGKSQGAGLMRCVCVCGWVGGWVGGGGGGGGGGDAGAVSGDVTTGNADSQEGIAGGRLDGVGAGAGAVWGEVMLQGCRRHLVQMATTAKHLTTLP